MSLGNPILVLKGRVRRFQIENIPAVPARPATPVIRDEDGTFHPAQPAREARPAYELATVTVDTGIGGVNDDGGIATVSYRLDTHGGRTFDSGDPFEEQVRPFQSWQSIRGRNVQVLRFGLVANTRPAGAGAVRAREAVTA